MKDIQSQGGTVRAETAIRASTGAFLPNSRVAGSSRYHLNGNGATSNVAEVAVITALEADGWMTYRKGWPDVLAVKGDQVRFVEIKPTAGHRLSAAQQAVADVLLRIFGITVELVVPTQQEIQQAFEKTSKAPADPWGRLRRRSSRSKPLDISLKSLPTDTEWWTALGKRFPGIDLYAELLKALDWRDASLVKSPKLFFRNWVERAWLSKPTRLVVVAPSVEEQLAALKRR